MNGKTIHHFNPDVALSTPCGLSVTKMSETDLVTNIISDVTCEVCLGSVHFYDPQSGRPRPVTRCGLGIEARPTSPTTKRLAITNVVDFRTCACCIEVSDRIQKRIEDSTVSFETKFKVGDVVRSRPTVTLLGCFTRMVIERVVFDHTHGNARHNDSCRTEAHVEYCVVVGAQPDGTATYRGRHSAEWLVLVERGGAL